MVWNINEFYLFCAVTGFFLIAIEVGFRFGNRHSQHKDKEFAEHISLLQSSVLGLLALLIGFTFAMAIERFDTRKQLVLEESNHIGTAYLRSKLLPDELHEEMSGLFADYVESRLNFYYAGNDMAETEKAFQTSKEIEKNLWNIAILATKKPSNPLYTSLFIQSLNDVIDANEKRQAALENRVPEPVILLLFFVSVFGMGFIGYNYGLTGKRRHGSTAFFAILIASVLIIILDIDRPRRGLILVSQTSLERLQTGIQQDIGPK
jgi:hypothetical protein